MIKGIGKINTLLIVNTLVIVAIIITFAYADGEAVEKIGALGLFIDKIAPLLYIITGGVAVGGVINKLKGTKDE